MMKPYILVDDTPIAKSKLVDQEFVVLQDRVAPFFAVREIIHQNFFPHLNILNRLRLLKCYFSSCYFWWSAYAQCVYFSCTTTIIRGVESEAVLANPPAHSFR